GLGHQQRPEAGHRLQRVAGAAGAVLPGAEPQDGAERQGVVQQHHVEQGGVGDRGAFQQRAQRGRVVQQLGGGRRGEPGVPQPPVGQLLAFAGGEPAGHGEELGGGGVGDPPPRLGVRGGSPHEFQQALVGGGGEGVFHRGSSLRLGGGHRTRRGSRRGRRRNSRRGPRPVPRSDSGPVSGPVSGPGGGRI